MTDKNYSRSTVSPIIGILCIDIATKIRDTYGDQFKSYLPASYVKFVEGGGGRVVPIWNDRHRAYYEYLLNNLNGILLPGGAVSFHQHGGYGDAGKFIFEIVKEINDDGNYMPILGICLGYELMLYASAGREIRQNCHSLAVSLSVDFQECAKTSKLFGNAPHEIIRILSEENVTYNYHKYCITEEDLKTFEIDNEWKILATSSDSVVSDYIAISEHKRYPFYGLQFHPEKNTYEHKSKFVVHTVNAVKSSNYLAQFFVNEARKNSNSFASKAEKHQHLIYNFMPKFILSQNISWDQCYLFESDAGYPQYQAEAFIESDGVHNSECEEQ